MKRFILLNAVVLGLIACADSSSQKTINAEALGDSSGIVGAETFSKDDTGLKATVGIVNLATDRQMCTGTLIAKRLVLTAGHCLRRGEVSGYDVQFFDGTRASISLNLVHHEFSPYLDKNDIAVLRISEDAPAKAVIASLPQEALAAGTYSTRTFGVGRTGSAKMDSSEMRMVNLKGEVMSSRPLFIQYIQTNGKGVCSGDSGGPHFIYKKNQPVLVAITTQSEDVGSDPAKEDPDYCRRKSIATLTGAYAQWIQKATKDILAW